MLDLTTPLGLTHYLASTKFEAADVQKIAGGYTGFMYRVVLKNPRDEKSVVVKLSLGYASSNKNMLVSPERMTFEYEALTAVAQSGLITPESTVQVPRVLFYDPEMHILIMEDLAPARTLSSILVEAFEAGTIESVSTEIGRVLGEFMGRFHSWSAQPKQGELRKRFSENITPIKAPLQMRYDRMFKTADRYDIKKDWMQDAVSEGMVDAQNGGSVIAMADFWVENILVITKPELRIYLIDWEWARCARPEVDVADLARSTYIIAHVQPSSSSFKLMQSFMQSYNNHFALDEVQIALRSGRDVISFGADMPWTRDHDDSTKKDLVGHGLNLLEAGMRGDSKEIRKNLVVRDMYTLN